MRVPLALTMLTLRCGHSGESWRDLRIGLARVNDPKHVTPWIRKRFCVTVVVVFGCARVNDREHVSPFPFSALSFPGFRSQTEQTGFPGFGAESYPYTLRYDLSTLAL